MELSRRLFLVLAFVIGAVAVPLSRREKCARRCTESTKFQYSPGTTYIYDYETLTTTNLKGTTEEQTQLQIKAQVDIEVLSKCDFSLRLRGVTLKQSDPQNPDYLMPIKNGREFALSAQKHILRFSYQDGAVDELCPDEKAPAWLTNIQRGILTTLQNTMSSLESNEKLVETDVAGECFADYQSVGRNPWRGTLAIKKTKDLSTCIHRERVQTAFQGAPFTHGSAIQSSPLVKGEQECDQIIGSGIVQSSICSEQHVLRPFSRGNGGATTSVHQRLTYVVTTTEKFTGNDYRPTRGNLLFEHSKEDSLSQPNDEEAERSLAKLCQASTKDVTIELPSLFTSFVYRMKKLDYDSLKNIFRKVDTICPNNPKARKFFLDAIPVVSTTASTKFMANLIAQREVDSSEMDFWFSSLAFLSEPTVEMIATLTPLLDGSHDQAFFGISSLVHTFCQSNDCTDVPEVRDVVHVLASYLGEYCTSDARKVLLSLKSLANIGIPFGREKILERCAMNPQLETEVRISAIQAFRRFSCDISHNTFLKMYSDYNEGSEIRIAAYLSAVNCPSQETLQTIRYTLEKEQVNQVGSFVWSHLQALSKSQHSKRQDIRDILTNLYLLNKYESDIRKFSSAKQASLFLDSLDTGLQVDTQLVYPTHSFLPHSATFNLTVDVFGHSCNLLQLDGRMEGMEKVLERFFGPSGLFPQKRVANLIRSKRSISDNKIEDMDRQFDVKSNFAKEAYGSLDVKIFGNTLWYNQFSEGNNDGSSFNLMDILNSLAQEQKKEYSRSFMFLDTTYVIPMATGLPLRLDLNGTATVSLKMGGKFNVRSFQNVDIMANIEPSGAVEIAGLLSIEAGGVTRTGLRIAATVHSSTVLDSQLEVRNGQVVKAQLNMPREKIEIVDVQSKLYLVYGSEEREQTGQKHSKYNFDSCTGKLMRRMLGVELCAAVSLPKGQHNTPMYPMNGAATFALYLKKTDPSLTAYAFDATWEEKTVNGKSIRNGILSLNTPNSAMDREVSLQFMLNEQDNAFTVDLKTPVKKLAFKAKYANDRNLKKLDLTTTVDNKDMFAVRTELRTNFEDEGISFFPSLEIQMATKTLVSLSGSAHSRRGSKYGMQLTVKELTERPIIVKGHLDVRNSDRYEGEMSINSFAIDTTTKASIQISDTMYVKLNTDYRIMESKQYKISVNGKIRDLSANELRKYIGVVNLQATAFPEWDTSVSWESMTTTGHWEDSFSISVGDGVRSRIRTINVEDIVTYKGDLNDNNVHVSLKFSYPEKRINYALEMKHENTLKSLKNELMVQYSPNGKISTSISGSMDLEKTRQLFGNVQLQYPGRKMKLSTELRESHPRDYRAEVNVQWQEGQTIGLVSHYKDKSDGTNIKHEADAEINFSYRQPIKFSAAVGVHRSQYVGTAEMNLGLDKYRMSADYTMGSGLNHKFIGQLQLASDYYESNALLQKSRDKFAANVEVKMPDRRRIFAKLDTKNSETFKTLTFESMWDADRDDSKRFGLDCETTVKNKGYDGKFTMQFMRRSVRGFASTTREGSWFGSYMRSLHKAEIEWSPVDKITMVLNTNMLRDHGRHHVSSNLDVNTLYKGYETMTMNIKHGAENQQWSSEASATWGNNKVIALSSDGKYSFENTNTLAETTLKFRSPFRNFESLSFNVTHFQNAIEFSNKMQLQWYRNKRITSDIYHNDMNSGFKCGMKVTTPFEPFTDLITEVTHSYSSGGYKTNGMLQWAPRKKIAGTFDLRHMFSGRRRTCTANFVGTSSINGYESVSAKLVYNNDGINLNTDVEFHKNQVKTMTTGFEGSLQTSYYNSNMQGKFYFTSPFRNFDNVRISSLLQTNVNSYKVNIDAQTPYDSSLSVNSEGKVTSYNDIEVNAVLIGKLPGNRAKKQFSLDFVHKIHNSNLRSTFDATYDNKQMVVLLTGQSNPGYKSQDLEATLSIKTPFKGYEEMKLNAIYKEHDWEFMTRIDGSLNKENILMTQNTNVKDIMNIESNFHLKSSIDCIRDVKITFSQIYNPGYFTHNSKVEWPKNKYVSFNTRYQSKISTQELAMGLTSSFEALKSCDVTLEQRSTRTGYKTKMNVRMNEKNTLDIDSSFNRDGMQKGEANLQITSNIDRFRAYKFNGKFDTTMPQKTASAIFSWNYGVEKIVSVSTSLLNDKISPKFEFIVITPFEDYEKIMLVGLAENKREKKLVSLTFEKSMDKVEVMAKYLTTKRGDQYTATFTSPYKNFEALKLSAQRRMEDGEMSSNVEVQWAQGKKMTLTAETSFSDSNSEGKLTLTTPFKNYETLSLDGSVDTSGRKNTAKTTVSWGNNKYIELYADCEVKRRKEGKFTVQLKTPLIKNEEWKVSSFYKINSEEYQANMELNFGSDKIYKGEVNYNKDGKFTALLNTPHRPIREVQLVVLLTNNKWNRGINSKLTWDNKEMVFATSYNTNGRGLLNCELNINVPIGNDEPIKIDGSIAKKMQEMDFSLTVTSPFETLTNLKVASNVKLAPEIETSLTIETSTKTLTVTVKSTKDFRKPMKSSLTIDAPFTNFKNLELTASTDFETEAEFMARTSRASHSITLKRETDDSESNIEINAVSPYLPTGRSKMVLKTSVTNKNMKVDLAVEVSEKSHTLTGSYKNSRNDYEAQINLKSTLLPQNSVDLLATYTYRQNSRHIETKVILPQSSHTFQAKYDFDSREKKAFLQLDSNLLPYEWAKVDAKYVNGNNKDLEMTVSLETAKSKHEVVASVKNYNKEKFFQLKIECPMLKFEKLSVTGTLKHEGFESIDGVITTSYPGKEFRIAVNMKRNGWETLEGFLAINTPLEKMGMLRIDTSYKNDGFKNIEGSLEIKSSNPSLPSLSGSAKLSRVEGSEDLSLTLHLPNSHYRTIKLLGNLHYNKQKTSLDSRVTLSLPSKRYSVYGHYILGEKQLTVDGEYEFNGIKWTATSEMKYRPESKGVSLVLTTPDRDTYEAAAYLECNTNRHVFTLRYNEPRQQVLRMVITLDYESMSNINVLLDVTTSLSSYRHVDLRLRHKREEDNMFHLEGECTINNQRGFFNAIRMFNRTDSLSRLRMESPFRILKDVDVMLKKSHFGRKQLFEVAYNRQTQLKAEGSNSRIAQTYSIDVVPLSTVLTASIKQKHNGKEFLVKTNCPSRTMIFHTSYGMSREVFEHETSLVWNEREQKSVSYKTQVTDISKGNMEGKEFFVRVNFPIRSLEMRGKLAKSGRLQSGGIDFYWDANRDTKKNMTIGVEHQDLSTRDLTSHRLQLTLTHPRLSKDMVQSNVLVISPSEFLLKSELQYSHNSEHNFIAELKANDHSRSDRDLHYKSEFNLRHLASTLEFKMTGELTNNNEEAATLIKVNSANRAGQPIIREIQARIQKVKKQIEIIMRSGENKMAMSGKMLHKGDDMIMTMDHKINNRHILMTHMRFNNQMKSLDMNVTLPENKVIMMSAKFPKDSVSLKLSHSNDANTYTDGFLYVGLEKSRIFTSRVNWRPGMWRDFRIATGDTLRAVSSSTTKTVNDLLSEVSQEWSDRFTYAGRALTDQMTPFQVELKNDLSILIADLSQITTTLRLMYQNNEFFSKDIVKGAQEAYGKAKALREAFSEIYDVFSSIFLEWAEEVYDTIYFRIEDSYKCMIHCYQKFQARVHRSARRMMNEMTLRYRSVERSVAVYFHEACRSIRQSFEKTGERIEAIVRSYAPCIIDMYYRSKMIADSVREKVTRVSTFYSQAVTNHPLYVALNQYWDEIVATVQAFQMADLTSSIQSRVLFMGEQVGIFMNKLSDVQLLDIIRNRIPVQYVTDTAKLTLRKGIDLYKALGMESVMQSLLGYGIEQLRDVALSSGNEVLHEFYQLKSGAKYEFDPKHGIFNFEYTLPTTSNSIYDVFNFAKYSEYHKLMEIKNTLVNKYYEDFCIWDLYYKIRNAFYPRHWLPPFTAHAMVAGNQHFVTFDKFAFDFAGECSYLLARDFVDGNFTVVANYKRDGQRVFRKSLTVLTQSTKIEVVYDYKVTLNDAKIELPVKVEDTSILRDGSNIRIENERKGLVVVCNFVHDICTIGMSGFYFGKTGGLFGTYDHEPNLDMMTPERNLATDVETFANSWEVGQSTCRRTDNMATVPGNNYRVQEKCKDLFSKSSSNFRACFKQVDPEPYFRMCVNDLSAVDESQFDSVLCVSSAAYFTECKIEGVELKMPKSCVRCETENGSPMFEGDIVKFHHDQTPRTADVVFIVEEKPCNSKNYKFLEKLTHSIEDNFRQQGFRDVRYRVVGFGGDNVHSEPHIHTIDGQEYGSLRSVESAFQSLQVGDGPSNALEALRFAAALNYHAGSVKSFVLLKCSTCTAEENGVAYGEVLRTLMDAEISLHVLMEHKYEMKIAKNSKAKKVIGLDKNFAYTFKDIKESNLLGDGDLLVQLKLPKDICLPLALEVNGSTFDSQYLTDTKRNTYKKFIDILSKRMLLSAKHHSDSTMCCECIATNEGVGKSTCQRCVSTQVANMISGDSFGFYSQDSEPKTRVRRPREKKRGTR